MEEEKTSNLIYQEEENNKIINATDSAADLLDLVDNNIFIPPPTPMRFKSAHDLALLHVTLRYDPFCSRKNQSQVRLCWEQIAANLRASTSSTLPSMKNVNRRNCKERVRVLAKKLLPAGSVITSDKIPLLIKLRQDVNNWSKFPTETLEPSSLLPCQAPPLLLVQSSNSQNLHESVAESNPEGFTGCMEYFDTSSQMMMEENVVHIATEAEKPEGVKEKLVKLESRVAAIEKQLTIIFDLINNPPRSMSDSKQEIIAPRQPPVNRYKARRHPRRITKATLKNHPNLKKLNMNPVVKIQKLPCPSPPPSPPAIDVDDDDVSNQSTSFGSIPGNDDIMYDYVQAEETLSNTSTAAALSNDDEVDLPIKIEQEDFIQSNDPDPDFALNSDQSPEGSVSPAASPPRRKSSKLLKEKQQQLRQAIHLRGCFKCPQCSKILRSAKYLQRHLAWHAREAIQPRIVHLLGHFKCPKCSKILRSSKYLQRHLKSQHQTVHPPRPMKAGVTFSCPHCSKSLTSRGGLSIHIKETHFDASDGDPPRPFVCSTCGKDFKRRSHLLNHQLIHSEARAYKCPYCDSRFRQVQGLVRHKSIHFTASRGKPQCSLCGQLFIYPHTLKLHVKRVHEKIRAYPCPICEKRFKCSMHLKYHLGTHSNPKSRKRGLNRDDEGIVKFKNIKSGMTSIKQIMEEESEPGTSKSPEIEESTEN